MVVPVILRFLVLGFCRVCLFWVLLTLVAIQGCLVLVCLLGVTCVLTLVGVYF